VLQVDDLHVPMLRVAGLSDLLGELGDTWYGQPSACLTVIAVTGTNGKTSTVQWIAQALSRKGTACGTIGTLGVQFPDGRSWDGSLTTPDVLTVHRTLALMRDAGAQAVALEASSIGLEQGRLACVRVAVAGFTNLTRDHQDYHGTMEQYAQAKARLFAWPGLRAAIINLDDPLGRQLLTTLPPDIGLGYSLDADASEAGGTSLVLRACALQASAQGQVFTLSSPQGEAQIVTPLLGAHNVANLLLVAGVLYKLGWPLAHIACALLGVEAVDGRLQTVEPLCPPDLSTNVRSPLVVVDYAHTPDALKQALNALRPIASARAGRLVCVFGCGGERDAGKRPEMGRIAAQWADQIVVTSDNPRRESAAEILRQILVGVPPHTRAKVQEDRARAILETIWTCQPEDVVLLVGKGHETYQDSGGKKRPFDDRHWARVAGLLAQGKEVSTDTRRIRAGDLFIALLGERFDGHHYLEQARARGACAAMVAHATPAVALPQLVLGDTREALLRMGAAWRACFTLPVITVPGSTGKTTCKEMIAAILGDYFGASARLATAGNLNNALGVPLSLLRLRARHRCAVFELGMNHPGEIAQLAALAAPTVALVTNAQREHQEFMFTVEAVARENGAALAALPNDGVAVYPGDEPYTPIWEALAKKRRVLCFGLMPGLDVYAESIDMEAHGTRCQLVTPAGRAALFLPLAASLWQLTCPIEIAVSSFPERLARLLVLSFQELH
jgi:murE/murF fusion protein